MTRLSLVIVAVTVLGATSARAQGEIKGNPQQGEQTFVICRACHQIGPGAQNAVGPVLNGVVGRKAGTYPGYEYSSANKNSGIVWTPQELNTYLTDPQKVVPGTKMIFPGLKSPEQRANVIAFLEQYGPNGQKK